MLVDTRLPTGADWAAFAALAADEGWRVLEYEVRLFRGAWAECARACAVDVSFGGMVTAAVHERSGWIGNLIVPPRLRGRGVGSGLFRVALERLLASGLESVWLTASLQGLPIYQKAGFVEVDSIERWVLAPRGEGCGGPVAADGDRLRLEEADRAAWGETRGELLAALAEGGTVFARGEAVALLQRHEGMQVIGPWYQRGGNLREGRGLLQDLLAAVGPEEVVVDLFASSPLRGLLAAAGFTCKGTNALMAYGDTRAVRRERMVSLASLGSVG